MPQVAMDRIERQATARIVSSRRVGQLRHAAQFLAPGAIEAYFVRKLEEPQIVDNSHPLGDNLN